jgi:hypothetical protein
VKDKTGTPSTGMAPEPSTLPQMTALTAYPLPPGTATGRRLDVPPSWLSLRWSW